MNKIKQGSFYEKHKDKPDQEFTADKQIQLLDFLYEKLNNKSAGKVKSLLYHKMISVDGIVTSKYDYPLNEGQKVRVSTYGIPDTIGSDMLNIIYEDDEIIVINKPAGLLTISTEKEKELTAYHFVTEYVKQKNKLNRIFIIHRLDRDTSGIVLFAKTDIIKTAFQDNWNDIVSCRGYIAITQGKFKDKSGRIESWLKETQTHLVYSSDISGDGKRAVTNYKVLKENSAFSIVEINLETGRKNQIRVHMKDIGHPIIGDKKYGSSCSPIKRLGLHADKLILKHPVTGKELKFIAEPDKIFITFIK